MKFFLWFFSLLLTVQLFAQEKAGISLMVNKTWESDPYLNKIFSKFVEHANASKRNNYLFYNWDEKNHTLSYNVKLNEGKKDQPSELLVFVEPKVKYASVPALQLKVDTSGKTTSVYYNLNFGYQIIYKVIDFRTSRIIAVDATQSEFSNMVHPNLLEISDYKNYFKGDPAQLKRTDIRTYAGIEQKIYNAYKTKINKHYDTASEYCAKTTTELISILNGLQDKRIYRMLNIDENNSSNKLVEFEIDGGSKDFLEENDFLYLYQKVKYGQRESVGFVANASVKEVSENSAKLKIVPFQRKKAAEALNQNTEIFLVRNKNLITDLNNSGGENYKISMDKSCLLCYSLLESKLLGLENIEIVEREHLKELGFFIEKFKGEQFMDFDMNDLQGKQLGVQVILQVNNRQIQATDVKTGKLLETASSTYDAKLAKLFLDAFEKDIELLDVIDEKKGKINELVVYHPFGFTDRQKLIVYEIIEEKVGSELMERQVEIGEGYISDMISDKIAPLKIGKGKKEIYKAMSENRKLKFSPS